MALNLTTTMTALGPNVAVARNVPLSAPAGSSDSATLLHGLGYTPARIEVSLRTVLTNPSLGGALLCIDSYDATTIVIKTPDQGAAVNVKIDVVADRLHTTVR